MAAFDRILSGIPEMDKAFDNIRLGDNVVFHPEKLESCPDLTGEFTEEQDLKDIVHVYDVSGRGCKVYNDIADEHLVITC